MATTKTEPRAVPFVSKATGMPLAKAAAKVMVGVTLAEQGYFHDPAPNNISVKAPVFPFAKFAGIDVILGPEMRSTGEVMGVSESFPIAFAKSLLAAGTVLAYKRRRLPKRGRSRQGTRSRTWPAAGAAEFRAAGHPRHGRAIGSGPHPRPHAYEAETRPSQRAGLYDRWATRI